MDISGESLIPTGREEVWAALNDPHVLRECIPGCEELHQSSETEMSARLRLKIGPVRVLFAGRVIFSEIAAPEGYVMSGRCNGGRAGIARGHARVRLEGIEGGGTRLIYAAEIIVEGRIAKLGRRLIRSTSENLARQFFENFALRFQGAGA